MFLLRTKTSGRKCLTNAVTVLGVLSDAGAFRSAVFFVFLEASRKPWQAHGRASNPRSTLRLLFKYLMCASWKTRNWVCLGVTFFSACKFCASQGDAVQSAGLALVHDGAMGGA